MRKLFVIMALLLASIGVSAQFTCGDSVTDSRDGKKYATVKIGNQCWMKSNMNLGTRISKMLPQKNNSILEKYCYDDLESNCTVYGGLYQWDEAVQYSTAPMPQGICPTGWHVPSINEFATLTTFLGGVSVSGGKMKEAGYSHWYRPNTGGTNTSLFTALPSGETPSLNTIKLTETFWTSSIASSDPFYRTLQLKSNSAAAFYGNNRSTNGYSIRCIMDSVYLYAPSVKLNSVTNITFTTASASSIVWADGGSPVIERGVCWSTAINPTTNNSTTSDGSGTGTFSSSITGLSPGTTYYVRTWAKNSVGTSYSPTNITIKTLSECPSSVTIYAANITSSSATLIGNASTPGGGSITSKGFCYSTSPGVNISNGTVYTYGGGTGVYSTGITGLLPGTTYYFKAWAESAECGVGKTYPTSYGVEVSFSTTVPLLGCGTPIYYAGASYPTVQIGTQCWMAKNLNIGTKINNPALQTNNGIIEKWCYENLESNCDIYGGLYMWGESMNYSTTEGAKGICPNGWHMPSNDEVILLANYLGGESVAGGKLKEVGYNHWLSPNTSATNITGFTAIGGGHSSASTPFAALKECSHQFTSTQFFTFWVVNFDAILHMHYSPNIDPYFGTSIRCIKDETVANCGTNITVTHIAGEVAPVTKTVTYGTVTNVPGEPDRCWITSNLGADRQALSATDSTEESAGWYWQFNKKQGYKYSTTRIPSGTWPGLDFVSSNWTSTNDPCHLELGGAWRLPSSVELTNIDASGGWNNASNAYSSLLKLHAAGNINDFTLYERGNTGYLTPNGTYWSSNEYDLTSGYTLKFNSSISTTSNMYGKSYGLSVRCVR